jgi:hypothetical protein
MTRSVLVAALNRLLDGRAYTLVEALAQAGAFKLATGKWARDLLKTVLPETDWIGCGRDTAVAALELAIEVA